MTDRLALARQRIERDFDEQRLQFPGLSIRPAREWVDIHPPAVPPPPAAAAEEDDDLVGVSGGHSFRIDSGLGDEEILVSVVSRLQDDAIDRLGEPWPALVLPDDAEAVLEPRLNAEGIAVWSTKAGYSCPIGELHAVFGVLRMIR